MRLEFTDKEELDKNTLTLVPGMQNWHDIFRNLAFCFTDEQNRYGSKTDLVSMRWNACQF
ncbi:MAG TPA: hypothetical protein VFH25_05530 [Nitrososphaeraceae archaeon]|nr:hypothetical protein [Nitrososphaeraceae archaeon]